MRHCARAVNAIAVQVADFLGDATGLQHEARVIADQLLAACSKGAVAEAVLGVLLDLSAQLLGAVMRACLARKTLQYLLTRLPFLLHAPLVQQRTRPAIGGIELAVDVPALPNHEQPMRGAAAADTLRLAFLRADSALDGPALSALCAQIVPLRGLVAADLSGVRVDTQMLAALMQALAVHSQLTSLQLRFHGAVSDIAVRILAVALPRWPQLRRFEVFVRAWQCKFSPPPNDPLPQGVRALTALTHLTLTRALPSAHLEQALAALTALRGLDLSSAHAICRHGSMSGEPLRLTALQRMQHLTALALAGRQWHCDENTLCTGLRKLDLSSSTAYTDRLELRRLTQLEDLNLEALWLEGTRAPPRVAAGLPALVQLTRLVLGDAVLTEREHRQSRSLDDEAAALCYALTHLTRLRELRICELLYCRQLTQALALAWQYLPQLTTLRCHVASGDALFEKAANAAAAIAAAPASASAPPPPPPALALSLRHLSLPFHADKDPDDEDRSTFRFGWLEQQLPSLASLQSLELILLSNMAGFDRQEFCYVTELIARSTALSQLQELRLHGGHFSASPELSKLPALITSLTFLQLRECRVASKFAERLQLGQLVHLALLTCACYRWDSTSALAEIARGVVPDSLRILRLTDMPDLMSEQSLASSLDWLGRTAVSLIDIEGLPTAAVAGSVDAREQLCDAFNERYAGEKVCKYKFV